MAFMHPQTRVRDVIEHPDALAALDKLLPGTAAQPQQTRPLWDTTISALVGFIGIEPGPRLDAFWTTLATVAVPDDVVAAAILPDPAYEPDRVAQASATLVAPAAGTVNAPLELRIDGPSHGNPFVDVELHAVFADGDEERTVGGFYDGDGVYRVRFLPPHAARWTYRTISTARSLDGILGEVDIVDDGLRGPVRVADTFHFAYDNGEPFMPVGTTAYAWTHQTDALEAQTLDELARGPFTKIRMCVFPKSYAYNTAEPPRSPYVRDEDGDGWDFTRFDPEFFRHLESRLQDLAALGVEADLILFHPYDRWGFAGMGAAADDRYVTYVVRRLAAFPNVWWSLANEWDFMWTKHRDDWARIGALVSREDHAGHLLGIHNGLDIYDHSAAWITHASMQKVDFWKTVEHVGAWRDTWRKPVVVDEAGYEGDLEQEWGGLSARELVRRAWETAVRGGYFTHGETYWNEQEELWWAKGGRLVGESPARIAFLARLVGESPSRRLDPVMSYGRTCAGGVAGEYELHYLSFTQPREKSLMIPPGRRAEIDVIDTWEMTIDTLPGAFEGRVVVPLPRKSHLAIRMRVLAAEGERSGTPQAFTSGEPVQPSPASRVLD
ncbi:DUF5605 domain-containing protein [Demequina soli]|uniref:DUF5605 domain-containing protein n=1 Tax=Demequina soli TaxID=1638987 RepID=UPI0009E547B2|nr:DUF5605 domain-containing protein [Demequina soli]